MDSANDRSEKRSNRPVKRSCSASATGSGSARRFTNTRPPVSRSRKNCENFQDPRVSRMTALSRSGVPDSRTYLFSGSASRGWPATDRA